MSEWDWIERICRIKMNLEVDEGDWGVFVTPR